MKIYGPKNHFINLRCNGVESCVQSYIDATQTNNLKIRCQGRNACKNMLAYGPNNNNSDIYLWSQSIDATYNMHLIAPLSRNIILNCDAGMCSYVLEENSAGQAKQNKTARTRLERLQLRNCACVNFNFPETHIST